ncbi:hypothetical protein ACLMJK_009521 [Lecanora helva]
MLIKSIVLSTLLCLSTPAIATYGGVVSSIQTLAKLVAEDDQDVNNIESVSGILAAQKIADDLNNLGSAISHVVSGNAGTAASNNKATEDQLTDAYSDFNEEFQKYLDDLIEKKDVLTVLLQQKAIYNAVYNLYTPFNNLNKFVQSLLGDTDHKDEANESASGGYSALDEAEDTYEVAT